MRAVSGGPESLLQHASQEAVGEGQHIYMRGPAYSAALPEGAEWLGLDAGALQSEQTAAGASTDPRAMLAQLRSLADVTEVGTEEVRGEPTTHYRGNYDPDV